MYDSWNLGIKNLIDNVSGIHIDDKESRIKNLMETGVYKGLQEFGTVWYLRTKDWKLNR